MQWLQAIVVRRIGFKEGGREMATATEKDAATRQRKHDEKWRRIKEREQPDELRGAPGGIRSGNVTTRKPRASLRSKGHR